MNEVLIGWAKRDVSTDKPVDIPGQFHMRISTGVMDPLTVTALVIDNGNDLACFLSFDFVAIRPCLMKLVQDKVAATHPEMPVEKIIFNATHTHTGASFYESHQVSMSTPAQVPHPGVEIASSDEYREFLATRAAEAVSEAFKGRSPGGIAYGYGFAVVGHSRRTVYFDDVSKRPGAGNEAGRKVDGHAKMYGVTNDNKFSHYEAGSDHFINLLYTFDSEDRLTGAIANVPCPSQCSEQRRELSADYWHDVRVALQEKYGDIFLVPQSAAAGDLSPRILHYREAQKRRFRLKYGDEPATDLAERKDIAERIVNAFTETLEWARKDIQKSIPLTHIVKTIHLSRRLISDEEAANETKQLEELEKIPPTRDGDPIKQLDTNSSLVARRNRCKRILNRYESQKKEPRFPMKLHVVRVGDVAFATNPFELYMDYMHRIQARSPFCQTFVVQLVGNPADAGGYLATERGAWGKGYSASLYCNQVSPEGGQALVEETIKVLKDIHVCD